MRRSAIFGYDGNDSYINSLTSNRPTEANIGLFGKISVASVHNLIIQNSLITGNTYVGAFVGDAQTSGTLQ